MYQQSSITLRCIVNAYILKFQKWNHSHKVANSQSRSDRFLRWPGEQNPWTLRWRRYSWSWTGLELTEFRCSLTETFHSIVSLKRKHFLTEFRALPALVVPAVPSTVMVTDLKTFFDAMVGLSGSRSDSSLSFGETRERLELKHLKSRNFVRATSKKRHSGGLETLKHYNKLSISPPQARKNG